MTDEQFSTLYSVLTDILAALKKAPTAASVPSQKKDDRDAPVPQPSELIDLPGAVEVPFGKNKGTKLEDLPANSLRWYAVSWELKERNAGGFWPADLKVQNAARQLWHAKHGSGKSEIASAPKAQAATQTTNSDEPLPF